MPTATPNWQNANDAGADNTGGGTAAGNTAAILTAISALPTAGGVVYFPSGIYLIEGFSVPSDVSLLGDGPGATVLKFSTGTGPGDCITVASSSANNSITNLEITPNSTSDTGYMINLTGSSSTVENVALTSCYNALYAGGGGANIDNIIISTSNSAFYVDGSDINITNAEISGTPVYGIIVTGTNVNITNTLISAQNPIYISTATSVSVTNAVISGIGDAVGVTAAGTDINLSGVNISGLSGTGVGIVLQAFNANVSNVHISGTTTDSVVGILMVNVGGNSQYRVGCFEINNCTTGISVGNGTYASNRVVDVFLNNGNITNCVTGILISNASGIYAQSIDIIGNAPSTGTIGQNAVLIDPNSSQGVNSCHFDQVLATSTVSIPWYIAGTGALSEIIMSSCWASGSTTRSGLIINNSAANGILVQHCNMHYNAENGIEVDAGTNINLSNNMVFANSTASVSTYHGIAIGANISGLQVLGNISGQGGYFSASNNQGYGIFVNVGANNYIIQNNRCPGNHLGGVSAATSATQLVGNNLAV